MPSATARSPVAAAMLNPALVATIVAAASEEYERATLVGMPWSFAFLVAPLVLHRDTRNALPRRTTSHWSRWLSDNPVLQAGFPARATSLVEPVRDGLRFGLRNGFLVVTEDARLSGRLQPSARPAGTGDIAAVVRASGFVGKWLAKLDQPATAFGLLGVEP